MKKMIFACLMMLCGITAFAQDMWKGSFFNKELMIRMRINLEKSDIPVPGLELENCYGYIQGNVNGSWLILKVKKLDEKGAVVRAMCDRGDVAQDLELKFTDDGLEMKQVGGTNMKGIADRKYVKLPKVVSFVKE